MSVNLSRSSNDGPRPAQACALVSALLSALLRLAAQHLQASNLASFDAEVGVATNPTSSKHPEQSALHCSVLNEKSKQ